MDRGVVLVGARCVGKSTVGARLAHALSLAFFDSDEEVQRASGRGVAALLRDGRLREWEQRVLADLLHRDGPAVVATGGGAVLWDGFVEACRGWRVIWLDADPGILARRIAADPRERPSLTGGAPESETEALSRERAPLYEAVAEQRIDTGGEQPGAIVRRLVRILAPQDNESVSDTE